MCNAGLSLSTSDLAQVVRNGLRLSPATNVAVSEVTRWTNLNYVFRATVDGSSIYLKAVAASPKHLPITLPKERIVYEARAIGLFRNLSGPTVLMPEVLFVDHENFVLGMTDVEVIDVEGTAFGPEAAERAVIAALARVDTVALERAA